MPVWTFRIGDVFDPDDALSVWVCTLSLAFNDAIHANLKVEAAEHPWERLYEWRVAIGHFNEACLHLERGKEIGPVEDFIASEPDLQTRFGNVLQHYDGLRAVTNRVRNEAAFHYPYRSGQEAVARALRELAGEEGAFGGTASTKIKDSRQFYADDVAVKLVLNASGGNEQSYGEVAEALGEGVAAFGRFANAALDAFFWKHQDALHQQP
jgi:hypothetical protein